MKNPVAKNMRQNKGGYHNTHNSRGQKRQKEQEALDEADSDYIEDCLQEWEEEDNERRD